MEIKKVGVVGCGYMGGGIVQVCAQAGYDIVTVDANEQFLKKGLATIEANLNRIVERGRMSAAEKNTIMERIKGSTDMKDFSDRDLVIEAITENMELKKQTFAELDKVCPEQTILASNTSCLSILDMAMATKRPGKVLGLHFFGPVPATKCLEIVRTLVTEEENIEVCKKWGATLSKTIVVAKDTPGFIVNRLLLSFLNNAITMLQNNVASKEDIDTGVKTGLNHPMGPLELADLIGLDVLLFISDAMYEEFKEPQYAPPTLLRKMVSAGWLGRKSGKGFYEYK